MSANDIWKKHDAKITKTDNNPDNKNRKDSSMMMNAPSPARSRPSQLNHPHLIEEEKEEEDLLS